MQVSSLRVRLILVLVLIVTLISTLFAGGVILIKQQLEAVIFGNMVRDQLQILTSQLDAGTYSDGALFDNWTFYYGDGVVELPDEILNLEPGSHHSVKVDDFYYQVEVGGRNGSSVFLAYDITDWERQEHRILEMLAYGVILVALVAVFLGSQASSVVLAPVTSLAGRVAGIQPRQRNVRIAEDYQGNEIGLIAQAFDRYLERLDQFVERERSFTAAASHELRTPLSVIVGALDVLDVRQHDPASQRALARIKRACGEMQAFIEATMFLSREDSTTIEPGGPAELGAIIRSLVEDQAGNLASRGIGLDVDIDEALVLPQPDSIVRILVSNILRNAIEHTSAGTITVHLKHHTLTITDTGSGIPRADLPHVFDRSYSTKRDGMGMGLNLVKRICDRFNWQIGISSEPGTGTRVTVSFPHQPG